MHAIRHYVFFAAGLIVIGAIAGIGPALWVAAGLLVSIGVNSLAGVAARRDERGTVQRARKQMAGGAGRAAVVKALEPGRHTLALVSICTFGSLVLAAASAAVLFIRYGWLPMTGFIVLFLGYFAVRETPGQRTKRLVVRLRATLLGFIAQREAGAITDEQLLTRSFDALDQGLSDDVRRIPIYYDRLLEPAGISTRRHHTLLNVLATYLETTEEHAFRYSELHQAVRRQLDLPERA